MLIHVILIYILKSLQVFLSQVQQKKQIRKTIFTHTHFPFDFSGNFRRINILYSLHFPLKYVVDCDFKVLIALWKIVSAQ